MVRVVSLIACCVICVLFYLHVTQTKFISANLHKKPHQLHRQHFGSRSKRSKLPARESEMTVMRIWPGDRRRCIDSVFCRHGHWSAPATTFTNCSVLTRSRRMRRGDYKREKRIKQPPLGPAQGTNTVSAFSVGCRHIGQRTPASGGDFQELPVCTSSPIAKAHVEHSSRWPHGSRITLISWTRHILHFHLSRCASTFSRS